MERVATARRPVIWMQRVLAFVFLLFCLMPLGISASAAERIDVEKPVSLTLTCRPQDAPLGGMNFSIYRVAEVSSTVHFTLTAPFDSYSVKVNGLNSASAWRAAANTLATYAAADGLAANDAGATGTDGKVSFTDLKPGLYLIVGEKLKVGRKTYTATPSLLCLPDLDETNDTWMYDVSASPKMDVNTSTKPKPDNPGSGGENDTVERTVRKVWEDTGHEKERPSSIQVTLLRDGQPDRTATLSENNGWRYTWPNLSDDYIWQVVEPSVPDGYTVTFTASDTVLVVTNTYEEFEDITPEGPAPTFDFQEEEVPPIPPSKAQLPQTGQLWWPVPLLAAAGTMTFGSGWYLNFRKKNRHGK